MYVYHKMSTCNERYFLCFWSAIIMRHIRWPSSALFIELYFRFSTRFSIFIELYFRFSILFSIFIHLYSRFDFCPLVFSIFIYLYYRFDFRPLVFSIFIHLYSRFSLNSIFVHGSLLSRHGPKVGGSVVPERAHGIARVYVYTYYRALGVLYQM